MSLARLSARLGSRVPSRDLLSASFSRAELLDCALEGGFSGVLGTSPTKGDLCGAVLRLLETSISASATPDASHGDEGAGGGARAASGTRCPLPAAALADFEIASDPLLRPAHYTVDFDAPEFSFGDAPAAAAAGSLALRVSATQSFVRTTSAVLERAQSRDSRAPAAPASRSHDASQSAPAPPRKGTEPVMPQRRNASTQWSPRL
jgi:hypothetical protein